MSHLHFTSTEEYRKRVIQLGENPERVFNVGELAIDSIKKTIQLSRTGLEERLNIKLKRKNLLITFHPVTLEKRTAKRQIKALLEALDKLDDTMLIFTEPNADPDSIIIAEAINSYVENNPSKAAVFTSMGKLLYLNALRHVDGVVGNSSSGITEAPSFQIGTVNIGDRQGGRIKAGSIIDCDPDKDL